MPESLIEVDGSYGEGGGAILRIACGLAVLTGKSVKISNIRKNRPKPGLRMQHLVGLQALAQICKGVLENGKIGATEVTLVPDKVSKGVYQIGVGTAGSVGLILQILQLGCIYSTGKITINVEGGATFGLWAPTIPYLEHVTLPQLRKMGYNVHIDLERHGFYPKGGAKVTFTIEPPTTKLNPLQLDDFGDEITEIQGISIASYHLKKQDVAKRQAKAAKRVIQNELGVNPMIKSEYVDALNPGSGICLWLHTNSGVILGYDVIGERGKPSEKIGVECARNLCDLIPSKATVDRFFSDQIIPFMALAMGSSIIKTNALTNHTKTNIWLVEKFLNKKFSIESENSLHRIKITNS